MDSQQKAGLEGQVAELLRMNAQWHLDANDLEVWKWFSVWPSGVKWDIHEWLSIMGKIYNGNLMEYWWDLIGFNSI